MDAGPILAQQALPILDSDNQDSLFSKLSELGAKMILRTIEELQNNPLLGQAQDETKATYAFNLQKEDENWIFPKQP